MRSLTRRGSWSSKFAATISKSLYAVWVKAPLPLQSPRAQMPDAVVCNRSSTTMYPRSSQHTPALSRSRSSVFGRRPTASNRCEPATSGAPSVQSTLATISSPRLARLMHCIEPDLDALALDDVFDRRRHVLVLVANEPRRHFDDRHPAAKAAVHLAKFEADIAAADNDEMARQKIDVHNRRIRQIGHFVYAGHRRHQRPPADIDKDLSSAQ